MPQTLQLVLTPQQAVSEKTVLDMAARQLRIGRERIAFSRVVKRSVDARKNPPKVNLTLELFIDDEQKPAEVHFDYPDVTNGKEIVIVGSGPAGLFAALRLMEHGFRPILFERGNNVEERKRDVAQLNRNKGLNPDSNYAFGEGGAGTFSDGKLFTRSKKRGDYNKALQTLVFHGASPEILYEAHPHIGTDRLPRIIENIRKTIESCGGKVHFGKRITAIDIKDGRVCGVRCGDERIEARAVILATGHSSRDIYTMLHKSGVRLEAKPFAMGVRVEHPQELIDRIQYHSLEFRNYLPAAAYTLTAQVGGRGVYSFCMCPGGVIVPALTSSDESVVNGMSSSSRGSRWANSGIVTEIRLDDFGHLRQKYGELAGLRFQQELEQAARANAEDNQTAPAQRLADFVAGRKSLSLPRTSYVPGTVASEINTWLPSFMTEALQGGFRTWGTRMRGFLTNEAQVLGVESRTSSPVRIPRDPVTLQHPEVEFLYPAGEGAGYAGGIISAALDGERIADALAESKLP
ncbi:MAG: FAD-dependent oxidoreductase [Tidjanibacter sp.]|nr:FAD-dependent oxidoreductase [Tidjanibacter sp.]MBR6830696.1 FAD-dependent oxidoreductase [Tidjanibacter sp.]